MCGIAGVIDRRPGRGSQELRAAARRMGDAIAHRGPDDSGIWTDDSAGVALAHRRLSIVDLSSEGHQPMLSASGRFVMVLNGEIYNYADLRREIDTSGRAPGWRGHSDTEVLLAACEAWGIEEAIRRSNGMFAIAIWDRHERELALIRDRMGEKPLYYGWSGDVFMFGSELKALEVHPQFTGQLDLCAVSSYLGRGYVPWPSSIYAGIKKLEPASIARIAAGRDRSRETATRYWELPVPRPQPQHTAQEAVEQLTELLRSAVKARMHADVPLGAFLSGGIDSSAIVALMQECAAQPVHTYSIGFEDRQHNEAGHAAAVATRLGTRHEEFCVTAKDALAIIPDLPVLYDEPFADSSQIPTLLLSRLTRRSVTVALSGDGGDELFGGYVRYLKGRMLERMYRTVPRPLRRLAASGLKRVARPGWDRLVALGPEGLAVALRSDRIGKLADVLAVRGCREMYETLISQWPDPQVIAPGLPPLPGRGVAGDGDSGIDPVSWMMFRDQMTYLPDDILVKVDRASMAVALEARVPFLDHRVVEFAARLPLHLKIRGGQGKWALRQVLYRYVDRRVVERPKQGFAIPLGTWLRGPLREWAEEHLSASALLASGMLDAAAVRRAWVAHQSGRENHANRLWVVLMLQAWLRKVRQGSGRPQADDGPMVRECH